MSETQRRPQRQRHQTREKLTSTGAAAKIHHTRSISKLIIYPIPSTRDLSSVKENSDKKKEQQLIKKTKTTHRLSDYLFVLVEL